MQGGASEAPHLILQRGRLWLCSGCWPWAGTPPSLCTAVARVCLQPSRPGRDRGLSRHFCLIRPLLPMSAGSSFPPIVPPTPTVEPMMDKPLGNQIFTAFSYSECLPFRNREQAAPGGCSNGPACCSIRLSA